MKNFFIGVCLAAVACSLQACTSKSSTLVPLVSQQHMNGPVTAMDGNGGGPTSGCPETGCPDPTPTP